MDSELNCDYNIKNSGQASMQSVTENTISENVGLDTTVTIVEHECVKNSVKDRQNASAELAINNAEIMEVDCNLNNRNEGTDTCESNTNGENVTVETSAVSKSTEEAKVATNNNGKDSNTADLDENPKHSKSNIFKTTKESRLDTVSESTISKTTMEFISDTGPIESDSMDTDGAENKKVLNSCENGTSIEIVQPATLKKDLTQASKDKTLNQNVPNTDGTGIIPGIAKPSTSKSQNDPNHSKINHQSNETPQVEKKEGLLSESLLIEPELFKRRKIDIYTEDSGPKWYDVRGNLVTRPILSKKLPEVYDFLPIFGAPRTKSDLEEFQNNKIREFVGGLNDEEFVKVSKYCSPAHLKTGKELTMMTNVPTHGLLPSDMDSQLGNNGRDDPSGAADKPDIVEKNPGHELCIVRKCKMRNERDTRNIYSQRLKYRGVRLMSLAGEDDSGQFTLSQNDSHEVPRLQPGKDVLIRVRIYRPFPYNIKDVRRPIRGRHSIFSRDIQLLGRHTLQELRERIVCPNDVDMRVDVSDRPHSLPVSCSKDVFPSGFLFINNKFYVDSRPGCIDYTERIRSWAATRGLGTFPRADMAGVKLEDLPIKLGHPEVYVHQGSCEHLFIFSEVRLLNASDPLKLTNYPRHTAVSHNQTVYCTTCAEFGARWIVIGCEIVPFDPAFFCDTCLNSYLYVDGKKIGDFKAYYYSGNEINMLKPQ